MQDDIPPPEAVVEIAGRAEKQRQEDECDGDQLEFGRHVDAVSPSQEHRDERQRDHGRGEEDVFPIAPEDEENQRGHEDRLDDQRECYVDILGFLGRWCVCLVHSSGIFAEQEGRNLPSMDPINTVGKHN